MALSIMYDRVCHAGFDVDPLRLSSVFVPLPGKAAQLEAPRYRVMPCVVPKMSRTALGVASVGAAVPPVTLALIVPAGIVAK